MAFVIRPKEYYLSPLSMLMRVHYSLGLSVIKNSKKNKVTIFDGTKIAELLLANCHDIAASLLGHEVTIQTATLSNLSNDTLMHALLVANTKQIENIYCDLQFALGRQSNVLFNAHIKQCLKTSQPISPDRASILLNIHKTLQEIASIELISNLPESLSKQQTAYHEKLKRDAASNCVALAFEEGELSKHILTKAEIGERISKQMAFVKKPWVDVFSTVSREYDSEEVKLRKSLEPLQNKNSLLFLYCGAFFNVMQRLKDPACFHCVRLAEYCFRRLSRNKDRHLVNGKALASLYKCASDVFRLADFYQEFQKSYTPFHYTITLNMDAIASWLRRSQQWLADEVSNINSQKLSGERLTTFLNQADRILEVCDRLFSCPELSGLLLEPGDFELRRKLNPDAKQAEQPQFFILNAPINVFFDTGLNMAIFGTAGAGKTTTLQMYAKKLLEANLDKIILFIPLASAMTTFKRRSPEYALSQNPPADLLLQGMSDYLNQTGKGGQITPSKLIQSLNSRGGILLLYTTS